MPSQVATRSVLATESGLVELRIKSYATKDDFIRAWSMYEAKFFDAIRTSFLHAYDGTSNAPKEETADEAERMKLYEQHQKLLDKEYEDRIKRVAAKFGLKVEMVRDLHNDLGDLL